MQLAIYAHPFDLDALAAHGGLQRLADLGFGEVALAASYHDGRWLQPWHPGGRVRFLEDGAVHFRPGAGYGALRPVPSSAVPERGPSPLERLCAEAPRHGLRARAWAVFHHNSRLGALHPGLCVENAFGDRYGYALCPAQPAVQEYAVALAADLGRHAGLGAVEFEALGWMGWKHGSHHDKASFAPRGLLDYALSLCLCERCRARIERENGDPERVRAWAKALVGVAIEQACAMAPPRVADRIEVDRWEAGDPETRAAEQATSAVRAARQSVLGELGRSVRAALPQAVLRSVQVHHEPLFTGSQMPVAHAEGLAADEFAVTAYGEGPAAIAAMFASAGMHCIADRRKRLSVWPKAPQFTRDEDLQELRVLAARHRIDSIAIYHLGLLPWRTIERVAKILTA